MVGWSFGGIVSVFAASKTTRFFAVVDQAGGSLSWDHSVALQDAMRAAARNVAAPLMCITAENDATTAAVKTVCNAASNSKAVSLEIYPPATPSRPSATAPGHAIFAADVVSFLDAHLPRTR